MTPVQSKLLSFIANFIRSHGYSPSFKEMQSYLGLASKSAVHRIVHGLEERGKIRCLPHRARGIEVVGAVPLPLLEPLTASSAEKLVEALKRAHGLDDGEGLMIVCSPEEALATLKSVLG